MTTTEKSLNLRRTAPTVTRDSGVRLLFGAGAAALVGGLLVALAGLLTVGPDALLAALIGTGLVVACFLVGALLVNLVASVMPAMSLLVALFTYLLQVLALFLALGAIGGSSWAGSLPRGWLAAAIIAATMCWMAGQVLAFRRSRIPAYDLPRADAR